MKKHLLILPLLPLAGFVLFALLWVYVQSDDFAARIRPYIAGPLQEVLGPGSRVGWIKANLLPPYLEARDIIIPSPIAPTAVTVRKIKIYINPFPLLWRRISIPSITVLEPRVAAVRSADGSVDLADLLRSIAENIGKRGAAGPSPFDIDIRSISLVNGTVRLSDASSRADIRIERLNIKARMRSRGFLVDIRSLSGRIDASVPAYPRIEADLHAALSIDQSSVKIRSAVASSPAFRFSASGVLGTGPSDPVRLNLTFRAGGPQQGKFAAFLKQKILRKQPAVDVSVSVTGTRGSPIVDGTAKFGTLSYGGVDVRDAGIRFSYRDRVATVTGGKWKVHRKDHSTGITSLRMKVAYEDGVLAVDSAHLTAEDAEMTAWGRLDPAAGYDLHLSFRSWGDGAALSMLSGIDISGDLAASGRLSGPVAHPRFAGSFSGGPVRARGVPVASVAGAMTFADALLSVENAALVEGRSRYTLNGSLNVAGPAPVFEATLDADHADVASAVALFYKRIPLDIAATGRLSFKGRAGDFSGSARLELDAGSAYGESFDSATLTAELSTTKVSFPSLLVRKKGGIVKGTGWIGFDGTYAARVSSTGIDLAKVDRLAPVPLSGPLELQITSAGSFSRPVVRARAEVDPLSVKGFEIGASECDLSIEGGKMRVAAAVRRDERTTASLGGTLKFGAPYAWSASVSVHAAELDAASFSAGNDMLAKARLSLDAAVSLAGNGADANAVSGVLQVPRASLVVGDYRIENRGDIRIRARGGRLQVDSFLLSGQGTSVSLAGSSGIGSDLDLTLTGDAHLSLLRLATRSIEHSDGTAAVNVRITGPWADPNMTGEMTIRNGLIKVRDVPQRFSGLAGTVNFDRNRIATEGLRGDFGGGTISVNGNVQMKNLKLVDFTSRTVMENVTFRYPPGLTTTLGGTLYYDGDRESQTLSGEVIIRRARYDRRVDFKTMLVDLSRGFRKKTKDDMGFLGDTKLDVRVAGKDDILFENNLAKVPLEMEMLLRGTVNRVQVLGHMDARKGEVYFRQTVFHITHASADFADLNKINPVLDVQAETRVREYQIRLSVTGDAEHAKVSFSSEPPLTDSNILALLTIGRRTEDIRGKESGVGSTEAIGFATGPAQDYVERQARLLTGLDRFQVDPYFSQANVAVPRVTAGKELVKDRLFVTYSANVGAAIPEQAFSIEYLVTRNVSLVGERTDIGDIGADIRFRFGFR